jgi:hypothetical protein
MHGIKTSANEKTLLDSFHLQLKEAYKSRLKRYDEEGDGVIRPWRK